MFISIVLAFVVDKILVAIDTFLFITGSGVEYRPMGEHCPPLIRNMQNISMALLTLLVGKRRIGLLALVLMIVLGHVLGKMNKNIFYTVKGFCIKKIECIVRRRKVTVHTVGDESLGIVHMGGCLPCIVSELNFMAGSTKLRRRCPNHGVVPDTEQRESDDDSHNNEYAAIEVFFHHSRFFKWVGMVVNV